VEAGAVEEVAFVSAVELPSGLDGYFVTVEVSMRKQIVQIPSMWADGVAVKRNLDCPCRFPGYCCCCWLDHCFQIQISRIVTLPDELLVLLGNGPPGVSMKEMS